MNGEIIVIKCIACHAQRESRKVEDSLNRAVQCTVCQGTGKVIIPPAGFLCVQCRGLGRSQDNNTVCEICKGLGVLTL